MRARRGGKGRRTAAERASRALQALGIALLALCVAEIGVRIVVSEEVLWPSAFHAVLQDHPTLIWTLRPDLDAPLRGGHRLRTNAQGYRDHALALPLPEERFVVLSLGESTTMGDWVAAEDTYSERLERRLRAEGRDAEVVNAGVGAWSIWQSAVLLEERGEALRPDVVLVHHQHNDFLPRGVRDEKSFQVEVRHTDRALWAMRRWVAPALHVAYGSRLYLGLRKLLLQLPSDLPSAVHATAGPRVPEEDRQEALTRMLRWCEEHGARLVIVQPTYRERFDDTLLARFAAAHGVPRLDLPAARQAASSDDAAFFVDSVHPTPAGHAFIAEAIYSAMEGLGGAPTPVPAFDGPPPPGGPRPLSVGSPAISTGGNR